MNGHFKDLGLRSMAGKTVKEFETDLDSRMPLSNKKGMASHFGLDMAISPFMEKKTSIALWNET